MKTRLFFFLGTRSERIKGRNGETISAWTVLTNERLEEKEVEEVYRQECRKQNKKDKDQSYRELLT